LRTRYVHATLGGGEDLDAKIREPGSSEVLTQVPAAELDDEAAGRE
jgi:hypothetical protein